VTDPFELCRAWYRRLPNPLIETVRVVVTLPDTLTRAADRSIEWSVMFSYKGSDGHLTAVVEQPVQLIPQRYIEDPRLPAYLDAVALALVEIMTTVGTHRFTPETALDSKAQTTDELAAEIRRTNPPDEWS
jgi:hypothetical protein